MAFQNKKSRIPRPQVAEIVKVPTSNSNPTTTSSTSTTTAHPLSKAMIRKPQGSNSTNKASCQPETWYDEKVESVSQRQFFHNKTEHEMRKEALFAELKKTEEELVCMQNLLVKREKLIKEAEEEANKDLNEKENASDDTQEGAGLQQDKVEKITKKTMKSMRERMHDMRERLNVMNRETDNYLADIENTMQYLETLEVASHRLGPLSAETRQLFGSADDEEIIAKINEENSIQLSTEHSSLEKSAEFKEKETTDTKSKFFLTEKSSIIDSRPDCDSVQSVVDDHNGSHKDNDDDADGDDSEAKF